MSAIDHLIHANKTYAAVFSGSRPLRPKLRLTVIACMDSRLDLFGALGLSIGDAHLIRNAGGAITDDVLRSLALSQRSMGTREVVIIHHTECGMLDLDDDEFRAQLADESGHPPPWRVPGFTDLPSDLRKSIAAVRECLWIPHRGDIRGFIFDVATAEIEEIS